MKQIAALLAVILLLTACGAQNIVAQSEPAAESLQAADYVPEQADPAISQESSSLPVEADQNTEPGESAESSQMPEQSAPEEIPRSESEASKEEIPVREDLYLEVAGRRFSITLADNAAAEAFCGLLPASWDMEELHGNEKYIYLDDSLPSDPQAVDYIETGDLMLYGDNCVVLFYDSFSTSYGYTRIGWVDDPAGLAEAVGGGDVTVEFRLA